MDCALDEPALRKTKFKGYLELLIDRPSLWGDLPETFIDRRLESGLPHVNVRHDDDDR